VLPQLIAKERGQSVLQPVRQHQLGLLRQQWLRLELVLHALRLILARLEMEHVLSLPTRIAKGLGLIAQLPVKQPLNAHSPRPKLNLALALLVQLPSSVLLRQAHARLLLLNTTSDSEQFQQWKRKYLRCTTKSELTLKASFQHSRLRRGTSMGMC